MLGNPGKRALPPPAETTQLASVARALPVPPPQLGETGARVWRRAVALGDRWIAETDEQLLVRYCEGLDEREALKGALAAYVASNGNPFVEGSAGQPAMHPAWKALRELDAQITKYEQLLGFTPADRSRIGTGEVTEGASPLENFLTSVAKRGG